MSVAASMGVSKVAAQSADSRIALTSHGRTVAVVDSAERIDESVRKTREAAAAVIDAAADLVAGRGEWLSVDEVCVRLGIGKETVLARAAELAAAQK